MESSVSADELEAVESKKSQSPSRDSGVDDEASGSSCNDGDNTGGIFFNFLLGGALGYKQMNRGDKLALFKNELILGFIIAFAQIPESVAFAFLAGLEPSIAIHSAWIMGLICAIFGGRPAMINGATGAFASIIGTFITQPAVSGRSGEGVETLFISVVLAGVLMLVAFALDLGRFVSVISFPIMLGFANGLAIVIARAQLHPFSYDCPGNYRCPFVNESVDNFTMPDKSHHYVGGAELGWMIGIVLVSMIVMEFVPKIPHKAAKFVPSSLLAILAAIFLEFVVVRNAGSKTDTIGDVAPFSKDTAFPIPFFIDKSRYPSNGTLNADNSTVLGPLKYDFDNLEGKAGQIVLQAFFLAIVGLIESLLTQEIVDKFTKTKGNRSRTIAAMGAGNIISGLLGGMGGNAMIGLSTINCLNGGRGRLAPIITALVVMVMVMGAYPVLNFVPVAALVGIMLVVVGHTFKWQSLPAIFVAFLPERWRLAGKLQFKIERTDVVIVVLVTALTNVPGLNLFYSIAAGVALSAVIYTWRSAQEISVKSDHVSSELKVYFVSGPLFFGNASSFPDHFDPEGDPATVEAHFSDTTLFDSAALKTLNTITKQYSKAEKSFIIRHLDPVSVRSVSKASRLLHYIELAAGEDIPMGVSGEEDPSPQPLVTNDDDPVVRKRSKDVVNNESCV
ncbi:putative sulfate transporter YbaR [Sycon ciliatum]|uniref:putative sulfate transporter YbaR n=1 Tax=Sycon ciliatum TaxID=27933 RepID=UPI0031F706D2